jgi:hypothetical protein
LPCAKGWFSKLQESRAVNPIGLAAIPDPDAGTLGGVLAGLIVVSTGAAALSLVLRFRRSQGVERQQLKWFTYGGALVFLGLLVADLLPDFPGSGLLFGVAVALLPVTAGIAILRYRLYDIDRLINRTLVYGLLTALLAAVYAGAVLFLGQVFGGVGGDPPSWAVAGATLAVAALFRPARRRIQAIVDRRFNAASTTQPRPSRPSALACAIRSTWTRSRLSC